MKGKCVHLYLKGDTLGRKEVEDERDNFGEFFCYFLSKTFHGKKLEILKCRQGSGIVHEHDCLKRLQVNRHINRHRYIVISL